MQSVVCLSVILQGFEKLRAILHQFRIYTFGMLRLLVGMLRLFWNAEIFLRNIKFFCRSAKTDSGML